MKIYLPNSAFIGNIKVFLENCDLSKPDELEVILNKKWVSLHPAVLCMVASLGLNIDKNKISVININKSSASQLEKMNFFSILGIKSGLNIEDHDPSGRFIPLMRISNSDKLTHFLTEMIPLLHLSPDQAAPIRYIVSELVRNVIEHSESKKGALVCAQYNAKTNIIRVGIADTGIGVRKSINQSHLTRSESEALRLALIPGITGTTSKEGGTELNAGAGLFFIKSIAYINRSLFLIYSGDSFYKLLKRNTKRQLLNADPLMDRHSLVEGLPYFNGTMVAVDISLETTTEFNTLLALIGDTYREAIRARRKARYKRARFI